MFLVDSHTMNVPGNVGLYKYGDYTKNLRLLLSFPSPVSLVTPCLFHIVRIVVTGAFVGTLYYKDCI